jgi:hypothetical protein
MIVPDLDSIVIRLQDAREVGGCKEGWKDFVEAHGYKFKDVVKNGLTARQLLATDDIMAINLVNYVIKRDYNG